MNHILDHKITEQRLSNKLLEDIENVILAHIYREGNDFADSFAKLEVGRSYMLKKNFNSTL